MKRIMVLTGTFLVVLSIVFNSFAVDVLNNFSHCHYTESRGAWLGGLVGDCGDGLFEELVDGGVSCYKHIWLDTIAVVQSGELGDEAHLAVAGAVIVRIGEKHLGWLAPAMPREIVRLFLAHCENRRNDLEAVVALFLGIDPPEFRHEILVRQP